MRLDVDDNKPLRDEAYKEKSPHKARKKKLKDDSNDHLLVSLKLRNHVFKQKKVVLIFLKDVTKKTREKIFRIRLNDQSQTQKQAESYRSTINHEMRTPLEASQQILIKTLNTLEQSEQLTPEIFQKVVEWIRLSISSITLTHSFVQDLLGVNQLNRNSMTLAKDLFDPNEVFAFIQAIFEPMIAAKGLKLEFIVVDSLPCGTEERGNTD